MTEEWGRGFEVIIMKPITLNSKEKELKEKLMKDIIRSKASDKEVINTICFILNAFKNIK